MIVRIFLYFAICCVVAMLSAYNNVNYLYADFKSYTDVLLNVSSAVFTLMGIWIAFLYPNALSRIVDPNKIAIADFSESQLETKRLEAIVGSVMKSAIVVLAVLAGALAKLFITKMHFFVEHILVTKYACLGVVTTLFVLQAEAIFGVILANVMFINDLHKKRAEKEIESRY